MNCPEEGGGGGGGTRERGVRQLKGCCIARPEYLKTINDNQTSWGWYIELSRLERQWLGLQGLK